MKGALAALALLASSGSALAQGSGYNLTQLLGYDFKVMAAVPGRGTEVLFLEGHLPGGAQKIVVRCIVRATADEGANNCQQVY